MSSAIPVAAASTQKAKEEEIAPMAPISTSKPIVPPSEIPAHTAGKQLNFELTDEEKAV